jgi:hypothetical protein
MVSKNLLTQLLNMSPKGVQLYSPFIKEYVEDPSNKYGATQGYHAALLSMNLNIFIKVKRIELGEQLSEEGDKMELADTDKNFLDSFTIIIADNEDILIGAYNNFREFIKKYLEGEDSENFGNALFRDFSKYESWEDAQ